MRVNCVRERVCVYVSVCVCMRVCVCGKEESVMQTHCKKISFNAALHDFVG